jgi:hypothetical protein
MCRLYGSHCTSSGVARKQADCILMAAIYYVMHFCKMRIYNFSSRCMVSKSITDYCKNTPYFIKIVGHTRNWLGITSNGRLLISIELILQDL